LTQGRAGRDARHYHLALPSGASTLSATSSKQRATLLGSRIIRSCPVATSRYRLERGSPAFLPTGKPDDGAMQSIVVRGIANTALSLARRSGSMKHFQGCGVRRGPAQAM